MEQIPLNTNIINCPELDDCIVYPNPSNEIIFINLSEKLKFHSARISISDYSGRIVFDEEFIPNLNKIAMNVSQFLPGVYLMTISINTGIMIKRKIIIEN